MLTCLLRLWHLVGQNFDRSIYEADRASTKCQELTINVNAHPVAYECDCMHSTVHKEGSGPKFRDWQLNVW